MLSNFKLTLEPKDENVVNYLTGVLFKEHNFRECKTFKLN